MTSLNTIQEPYCEQFIMTWPDGPNSDDDQSPDCYFACNVCGQRVDDGPCPEHAPLNVPGLQLVECNATPRHPHTWMVSSEAYPPPCMYCCYQALDEQHRGCDHAGHGRWRRWRLTNRLAGWAYTLGIVSGYTTSYDGHPNGCSGCVHHFGWRSRRPYILGWPAWKWVCLLRQRHWPGVPIGLDSCAKCLPCPDCGSSTSCFDGMCENKSPVEVCEYPGSTA